MRYSEGGGVAIAPGLSIPGVEIDEAASRSGGPGGQHVNKTNTRVTLRWNVRRSRVLNARQRARLLERLQVRLTSEGDLIVHADRTRSRSRNREHARARLAELVSEALSEPAARRPTTPSRASKLRVKKAKTIRSQIKRRRGRVPRDDS
ncbi:MAG: aminoacyl-tRNA hydrolase [bacterium]|nr:aminoacyl-tRNA hydrolase [bacterium]